MFINYAHRGASAYFPENTLSSFYAGLNMGANGIETDLHRTKDGVLVLFHDDDIGRVTDGKGPISNYSYQELMNFRVFHPTEKRIDTIVTLQDFLKYFGFRDLTFAIELKQSHIEREVIDMLESFHMSKKTILTSFDYEYIKNAKAYNPRYRVGLLFREDDPDPAGRLQAIRGEELCPPAQSLNRETVDRYHNMGFNVRAWGVHTEEIMEHAYTCGIDGMTVNFPDLLTQRMKRDT